MGMESMETQNGAQKLQKSVRPLCASFRAFGFFCASVVLGQRDRAEEDAAFRKRGKFAIFNI